MRLITAKTKGLLPLVGDITGQYVVLPHTKLHRRYQMPRFQIFKATGGFGCQEGSLGSKVYGVCIADNQDDQWRRNDFIGIATKGLIDKAMADTTPVPGINPMERHYLLVSTDGYFETGDTVNEAMQRLRLMTKAKVVTAYLCHPESTLNDLGFLSYPAGTDIAEIKVKRQGGVWIDAS